MLEETGFYYQKNKTMIFNKYFKWLMVVLSFLISEKIMAQGCNFSEMDSIEIMVIGNNTTADFTQSFALTDDNEVILDISSNSIFPPQPAGSYQVYALNYETACGISNYAVGNNMSAVTGKCLHKAFKAFNTCGCDVNAVSADLDLMVAGQNTAPEFSQQYTLTDGIGQILQIISGTSFTALSAGIYNVYATNYKTSCGINNHIIGNNISQVTGSCVAIASPVGYNICGSCSATNRIRITITQN